MHLNNFFNKLTEDNDFIINNVFFNALPWIIGRFLQIKQKPMLWIAPDIATAEKRFYDLKFYTDYPTFLYPSHDSLAFMPVFPSTEIMSQRIEALYNLTQQKNIIFITTIDAICEGTISPKILGDNQELIIKNDTSDRDRLIKWLVSAGYERVSIVQHRGEFSVRGGIFDIFPPSHSQPVRLDMFSDVVEEIKYFDPLTQVTDESQDELDEIVLLPVSEIILTDEIIASSTDKLVKIAGKFNWNSKRLNEICEQIEERQLLEEQRAFLPLFYNGFFTPLDFFSDDALVILENPNAIKKSHIVFYDDAIESYSDALAKMRVVSGLDQLAMPVSDFIKTIYKMQKWLITERNFGVSEDIRDIMPEKYEEINFDILPPKLPEPPLSPRKDINFLKEIANNLNLLIDRSSRVVVVAPGDKQGKRLKELFKNYDVDFSDIGVKGMDTTSEFLSDPKSTGIYLKSHKLSGGFYVPSDGLMVITEEELLGTSFKAVTGRQKKEKVFSEISVEELKPGDYIVHRDHGVGLYNGLIKMQVSGITGEFLHLEYRNGDKLYLPIDRLNLIQKYIGIEGKEIILNKLGGSHWALTREKIKRALYEIATELVELYAQRRVREGHAFSPPDMVFREFEADFPYEETPDQQRAIDEIIDDMISPKPMDRLLCGDVGVGKTEVVMRAAFKAALDKKQVAVLVPTTLLSEQHERTFKKRFQNFPVNIAAISRLKQKKDIKDTLQNLSEGKIDILIGTHKLLQANVHFKDLGLLVIDEEHRFGVKQKESIKKLKQTVDSLALTATPIPRTLQLSLLDLRDLSIIKTPPKDRLPVKTYLSEFDLALVKGAIKKEIERGGQVFFVNNRITGIYTIAEQISKLLPDLKIGVGHGQMESEELENVIIKFVRAELDCLVCTTIIESGIDIPTANTIIINRADRMGLAELHQLRGRVGRSNEQAYCYLLVPSLSDITNDAKKRLSAVMDTQLGTGGFSLAMHDLQIRGAGNILGLSQSGQIADVGYEMYLDILMDIVEELKGEAVHKEEIDPEINIGINAFIPDSYIEDMEQRLKIYRRLAKADDTQAPEIAKELIDRFGEIPEEVRALFELMAIKRILKKINVVRCDRSQIKGEARLTLHFGKDGPPDVDRLFQFISKRKNWRLTPEGRLIITYKETEDLIRSIYNVVVMVAGVFG